MITHGALLGAAIGGHGGPAPTTLAYAAPEKAGRAFAAAPPVLPPLRAAALGKAEDSRAAKAVAAQMAPARVDRGALKVLAAPAPQLRARPPVSGGVAPPLRAAAKHDVLIGHETAKGVATGLQDAGHLPEPHRLQQESGLNPVRLTIALLLGLNLAPSPYG